MVPKRNSLLCMATSALYDKLWCDFNFSFLVVDPRAAMTLDFIPTTLLFTRTNLFSAKKSKLQLSHYLMNYSSGGDKRSKYFLKVYFRAINELVTSL